MTEKDTEFQNLEAHFAAARAAPPDLSEARMARIMADAQGVQTAHAAQAQTAPAARPGLLFQLRDALGGWPALGGLAAAGMAGIWLGFAPPVGLPDAAGLLVQSQSNLDLLTGDGLTLALLEEDG